MKENLPNESPEESQPTEPKKKKSPNIDDQLKTAQLWVLIATLATFIYTTLDSAKPKKETHYFPKVGYILEYTPQDGSLCFIPENENIRQVNHALGMRECEEYTRARPRQVKSQ